MMNLKNKKPEKVKDFGGKPEEYTKSNLIEQKSNVEEHFRT